MSAKCSSEPQLISSGEEDNESEQTKWRTIHGITLTQKDRDIILNGEWLNDNIINAAQCLMKHDQDLLPVGSLQNPLLGQTLEFDVVSDASVQILQSGGNHWITISTVGTKHPTVKVFDSLYNELPWETKLQIAALLQTKESTITLEFANVQVKTVTIHIQLLFMVVFPSPQKQRNGADCGVFAIAFAVAICNGQNPEELIFQIPKMCRHLSDCLEDKQIRHFPANIRQHRQNIRRVEKVLVHCKCCLQEEGDMICCEGCDLWYHSTCVKTPKDSI